jgi:hypothetical protein
MISSRITFQDPDGLLLVRLDIRKHMDIYNINVIVAPGFFPLPFPAGIYRLDLFSAEWEKRDETHMKK